jgi:hypothetical protein
VVAERKAQRPSCGDQRAGSSVSLGVAISLLRHGLSAQRVQRAAFTASLSHSPDCVTPFTLLVAFLYIQAFYFIFIISEHFSLSVCVY